MPHERDDAIRRLSSSIRSGVRATSIPPLWVKTPISLYWSTLSAVSAVISREWSVRKMKFEAWPVEPPGFGSGALLDQDDVAPAQPGEVVDEAVADDAGADDDDARGTRLRAQLVLLESRIPRPAATSGATTVCWRLDGASNVADRPPGRALILLSAHRRQRAYVDDSAVRARLEAAPIVGLELERRMLDVEVAGQAFAQEVEHRRRRRRPARGRRGPRRR